MINNIRAQFPQYEDMNDDELVAGIHQKFYPDIPQNQFRQMCGCCPRPNHADLGGSSVRGEDSLTLQEIDPTVKPAVKMAVKELQKLQARTTGKIVVIWNDAAYVIDPSVIDPAAAMIDILNGTDSEILGYPSPGPLDAAVTKQGEVITDIPRMMTHAATGNVIWAASGQKQPLMERAGRVASVVSQAHRGMAQGASDGT